MSQTNPWEEDMSKPIKVIQMVPDDHFTDNYGGEFPNAVVVLNHVVIDSRNELSADYGNFIYDDSESTISGMAYSCNFWVDRKFMPNVDKANPNPMEKRSRPLLTTDYNAVFVVDMSKYSDVYDNHPGDFTDAALAVCERHFRNEVLPSLRV